jgi:hypothetical protein
VCFGCDFCENRDLETDNNEWLFVHYKAYAII